MVFFNEMTGDIKKENEQVFHIEKPVHGYFKRSF